MLWGKQRSDPGWQKGATHSVIPPCSRGSPAGVARLRTRFGDLLTLQCQPRVNEQKERHLAFLLSARLRWLRGPDLN